MDCIFLLFVVMLCFWRVVQKTPLPAMSKFSQNHSIDEFIEVSYYKEDLINYTNSYLEFKMFDYNVTPLKVLMRFHKNIESKLLKNNSVFLIYQTTDLNITNQLGYAIENIRK